MKNKSFMSILAIMFILFVAVFGSTGCIDTKHDKMPDNPNSTPDGTFTVTFDSNGGSEVPSQEVEAGGTVTMPDNPTKNGYVFAGWFKDNTTFENMFRFGTDGDKVTQDITLYAQWLEPDTLVAEYALSEVVIGYSKGDNPKYVTQNLNLPTKIDRADISWVSSSSAVSTNGTVTRQTADENVTLTATATYNGKSVSKEFNIKVIRKRTRDNSKIQSLPLEKVSSGNISITRNDFGNVQDVEGNYADFNIENADDAVDAITAIKDELGIKNPASEIEIAVVTSDNTGAEYRFRQIYNGVSAFGRGVMASANAKGKSDFLHSNLLSSDIIAKIDDKTCISSSEAETIAKASYTGEVEVDSASTEKIIYSLDDYETVPVYAYIVRVHSSKIDESLIINADTSSIIDRFSNISFATAHGSDETGLPVTFPVLEVYNSDKNDYIQFMYDITDFANIKIFSERIGTSKDKKVGVDNMVKRTRNQSWDDGQQISAYINMRKIMRWWKESFDRNSLDNAGMTVKVVTHQNVEAGKEDNAFFGGKYEDEFAIYISDKDKYRYSPAVAKDILAHETAHAVFLYNIGSSSVYSHFSDGGVGGAINEAYADIFGCLIEQNWIVGEAIPNTRNIANPDDENATTRGPSKVSEQLKYENEEHVRSLIVSHAAYLMHEDNAGKGVGLTWAELAQLWYKSMSMGYLATSKFPDVRRCVLWAAMKEDLSAEKIAVIKAAFDEVEITTQKKARLYGFVTDATSADKKLENADVIAYDVDTSGEIRFVGKTSTAPQGQYVIELEAGKYTVFFNKENYERASSDVSIISKDVSLNKKLVPLASISGIVMSSPDKEPLSDVTVQLWKGSDVTGTPLRSTITGANGDYFFDLKTLVSSKYTLVFSKSGYQNATLLINLDGEIDNLKTYLTENQGISGTVYASSSKEVLEGVTVQLFEGSEGKTESTPLKTTTTNSSGGYSFSLNENGAGNYKLVFSKKGYKKVTFDIAFTSGTSIWQNAYLDEENLDDIPIDEEHFPDERFRSVISEYDYNKNGILDKEENASIEALDLNSEITYYVGHEGNLLTVDYFPHCQTLTGIEYLTSLVTLICINNDLKELDLSNCKRLSSLSCGNNQLIALNVSKNTALTELSCGGNQLTTLNVTHNPALEILYCSDNLLTELDVSQNPKLRNLDCGNNQLTILDVSQNAKLYYLSCGGGYTTAGDKRSANKLTTLDVTHNPELDALYCDNNQLTTLDVTKNPKLTSLHCGNNQLTALDLTNNTALNYLSCEGNQLTVLDLSNCAKDIYVHYAIEDDVNIIWPSSSQISTASYAQSEFSRDTPGCTKILATIPSFTAMRTGEYVFDVSLDEEIPEDAKLILLNDSEDLNGFFVSGDKNLKVSADFEAGQTYSPVIVAKFENQESNSGGCNVGACSIMISLAGMFFKKK